MTEISGSQSTIGVSSEAGLVSLRQESSSGQGQTIVLDVQQAEGLANWLIQFVRLAREEASEE